MGSHHRGLSGRQTHNLEMASTFSQDECTYTYDVIIIGAGPAGLSTAIMCGTRRLKILLLEKDKIGGASFFRTKVIADRLLGSFLTAYPEKLKEDIEKNPSLKFISIEMINPEIFIEYENSIQESIN